jgi:hypothetical protein
LKLTRIRHPGYRGSRRCNRNKNRSSYRSRSSSETGAATVAGAATGAEAVQRQEQLQEQEQLHEQEQEQQSWPADDKNRWKEGSSVLYRKPFNFAINLEFFSLDISI